MSITMFLMRLALKTCSLLLATTFLACDPCYELSERICACKDNEEEKRECVSQLNQAKTHGAFSIAREPKRCEKALEPNECTCKDIRDGKFEKCALYRNARGG